MPSKVEICNLSLQLLGAKPITLLSEDNVRARACNRVFDPAKLSEMRSIPWNFARARASLAASSTKPAFGFDNAFPLPSNLIKLLGIFTQQQVYLSKYQIEGREVLTDDAGPVFISYLQDITDTTQFDDSFVRLISARMAVDMSEQLTQSSSKKEFLLRYYTDAKQEARKANAFENVSQELPRDPWVAVVEV